MESNTNSLPPMMGASLEGLYLNHILQTLVKVQDSFTEGNTRKFSLLISYLESAILDEYTKKEINIEIVNKRKILESEEDDKDIIEYQLGFVVVKHVMKYLNSSLDLTHEDIIGSIGRLDKVEDGVPLT